MRLAVTSTWGQTDVKQNDNQGINKERARLALQTEPDPLNPGQLRCISEEARLDGCAPFDVFGRNTVSPAAVDYLRLSQNLNSTIEQTVVASNVTDVLPWQLQDRAIGWAVGIEYRDEKGSETPDAARRPASRLSNKILPTNGSFDVTEAYAEISVPVLEKLTLDASYRVGDYSTVGDIDTWGLRAESPILDGLTLRGTLSSSVRAPNVADLYSGAGRHSKS